MANLVYRVENNSCQNALINLGSLSEMIVLGTPWAHRTLSMNKVANPLAVIFMVVGTAIIILEKRSTTTNIALYPLDTVSGPIRSSEISVQGLESIGMGCKRPNFL